MSDLEIYEANEISQVTFYIDNKIQLFTVPLLGKCIV